MPRPKAATPAAHIRGIVKFFETAPADLAEVAFELARAALSERKAKKKPMEKPKTQTRGAVQTLAVPAEPAAPAAPPETPSKAPSAPPAPASAAQVARPANKKRAQAKKKKAAGRKRPYTRNVYDEPGQDPKGEVLPEQHPIEEQAEPPGQSELRW